MNIEIRVERLEKLAAVRARERLDRARFCGPIPLAWDGDVIHGCLLIPCDHVPTLQEAITLGRAHETCPEVAQCRYALAGVCVPKVPS